MELDKICRLCLTIKKDMRNIFTNDNLLQMISEFSDLKIENNPGWPEKICIQCLHQVSRCHSFKKRIEKSDEQLKQYIKSLTVIVEEPVMKEMRVPEIKQHQMQQHQPQLQEIQIQRPEAHPMIIANVLNNSSSILNTGHHPQLIQTANGQIIQAQIGQFIQGPNNTIQMITTNPTNHVASQPQLLQLRTESDNRCELIMQQPSEMTDSHFFEEIPVVVQNANGQQTILNLPHHQVQALQQQIAQSNNNHHQQQVQVQQIQNNVPPIATNSCNSENDEIEIHEIQDYGQSNEYECDEMEEVIEDEQDHDTSTTYIVETIQEEESSENSDTDDKQLLAEFLAQQTHSEPGKHVCNLCNQEFKHMKWLHSHMKTIHNNYIKANCKKQPQCSICSKSFRGPGMLKMHMKTHEKGDKLPTCTICSKEFKSKSILYRHRATHFASQKEHRCTICDKNFSSNYQLNAHVQRHQKNHQCVLCEKSFSNANDLKNHMQQHSDGNKPSGKKSSDEAKSS